MRHRVHVIRRAVQVGRQRQREFLRAIGIGGKVKTFGRREAKTKVKVPVGRQRETAVNVQLKAWNVKGQRDVHAHAQQTPAQVHVELDRIDTGLGQGLPHHPGRHAQALGVIKAHIDVIDGDQVVVVVVLEDVQIGVEDLVQGVADQLHRLAWPGQLGAQIQQQAAPQAAQNLAGIGQALTNKGQVGRHATLEQVLHRTQTQVDAVQHKAGVIQQVNQRVLAHFGQVQIGQLDIQRRSLSGRCQAHQL